MAVKPPRIRLLLADWTPASLNRVMYAPPRVVSAQKRALGRELYYLAYAQGYRPARHDYYRHASWTITFATRRRRDKGNWEKILNDALVYSGLVEDDSDRKLYWHIELNPEPGRRGVELELW